MPQNEDSQAPPDSSASARSCSMYDFLIPPVRTARHPLVQQQGEKRTWKAAVREYCGGHGSWQGLGEVAATLSLTLHQRRQLAMDVLGAMTDEEFAPRDLPEGAIF